MYTKFHGEGATDKHIKAYFPDNFIGTFIDVGAYMPIQISNSFHFEQNGWNVICIEANPYCIHHLIRDRSRVLQYAVGSQNLDDVDFNVFVIEGMLDQASMTGLVIDEQQRDHFGSKIKEHRVIKVKVRTMDWLLENKLSDLHKIDVLSVDTEGSELDVLKGFNINKWHPKLIVIEEHQESDIISSYLFQFGYHMDKRAHINNFYKK